MPYLLLTLAALFWSGNFVISRGMHADIPPLGLSFWRWLVALLILLLFAFQHLIRQRRLVRRHLRFIIVQGLLGVAGFNTLIYLAMQTTTAINAVLVNSCIPVLIAVCSWIMFREALTVRQGCGVLLSLCGVVSIIAKGRWEFLLSVTFNPGDLLVLAAALLWALYSTNLKNYPRDLHPFAYQSGIVVSGLVVIFPCYLIELSLGKTMNMGLPTLLSIGYVALFASILAFIFWNKAVRTVGPNKSGPFIHLMPAFSTILAVLFLGETIEVYHLLGIALIFSGIMMTTFRVRPSSRL